MSAKDRKSPLDRLPAVDPKNVLELAEAALDGELLGTAVRVLASTADVLRRERTDMGDRASLVLAEAATALAKQAMNLELVATVSRAGMHVMLELLAELPEGPMIIRELERVARKARAQAPVWLASKDTRH